MYIDRIYMYIPIDQVSSLQMPLPFCAHMPIFVPMFSVASFARIRNIFLICVNIVNNLASCIFFCMNTQPLWLYDYFCSFINVSI